MRPILSNGCDELTRAAPDGGVRGFNGGPFSRMGVTCSAPRTPARASGGFNGAHSLEWV